MLGDHERMAIRRNQHACNCRPVDRLYDIWRWCSTSRHPHTHVLYVHGNVHSSIIPFSPPTPLFQKLALFWRVLSCSLVQLATQHYYLRSGVMVYILAMSVGVHGDYMHTRYHIPGMRIARSTHQCVTEFSPLNAI